MYIRGRLLNEGKTKGIWEVSGQPELVIVEEKDDITALDDKRRTRSWLGKGVVAATTTKNCFALLKKAGLQVAYVPTITLGANEFLAKKCQMLGLEVTVRRRATGSYRKRYPDIPEMERFEPPLVELFLKTTNGSLKTAYGEVLVEGLDPLQGEEDPLITNPLGCPWELWHSKKPLTDPSGNLKRQVKPSAIFPASSFTFSSETIPKLLKLATQVFLVLEYAWSTQNCSLIDFKEEFGLDDYGQLLLADVVDNDSWRLKKIEPGNVLGSELSKQVFRDTGEVTQEVIDNYQLVAALSENFSSLPTDSLQEFIRN